MSCAVIGATNAPLPRHWPLPCDRGGLRENENPRTDLFNRAVIMLNEMFIEMELGVMELRVSSDYSITGL